MQIIDMISSPSYNPSTNKDRGDWSLYDVSNHNVFLDDKWNKPNCINHGAMNAMNAQRTIWRCTVCSRSCYDLDAHIAS